MFLCHPLISSANWICCLWLGPAYPVSLVVSELLGVQMSLWSCDSVILWSWDHGVSKLLWSCDLGCVRAPTCQASSGCHRSWWGARVLDLLCSVLCVFVWILKFCDPMCVCQSSCDPGCVRTPYGQASSGCYRSGYGARALAPVCTQVQTGRNVCLWMGADSCVPALQEVPDVVPSPEILVCQTPGYQGFFEFCWNRWGTRALDPFQMQVQTRRNCMFIFLWCQELNPWPPSC